MTETLTQPIRRRGKEWRERVAAALIFIPAAPVLLVCAAAIKVEGIFDSDARGPVFFREQRISRGRVIDLLKLRVLRRSALLSLGPGPTHIAVFETSGGLTRVGRVLKQWYLDELPQLLNILRGDMFLVGTRPYPLELYEKQIQRGVTLKRDMPAGLVGIVQAHKGDAAAPDRETLDLIYWDAFLNYPGWKLLLLDLKIILRSGKVQLEHKGI